MNIKKIIAVNLLATIMVVTSYFAVQYYKNSYPADQQTSAKIELLSIGDQIESLQQKNIIDQDSQIAQQDEVVIQCGGQAAPCSQSSYCCSGCCYGGVCTSDDDAYWCCATLDEPCTGQSGNTHGSCCTDYVCAACYEPNSGANDLMAAPAGQSGLCQTNDSWIVINCGSGGIGAPCYNSAACQSDLVCSANMCQCNPDGCAGVACPCTSNTECCDGCCWDGLCEQPIANCITCYNDGQCASGNCVIDPTTGSGMCYETGCKYGTASCDACYIGGDCDACDNSDNCSSGNCVNGICYITDCVYGATACDSCNSGDLGDTCNGDSNCQAQYVCIDGFCSCGDPAGYNCPCNQGDNSTCASGLICTDASLCGDCYADGGPCNNDTQCCNNTCINGLCSYAPANGGECAENSQCNSGDCYTLIANQTGTCQDCIANNMQCLNDGQCCTQNCSADGYCVCQSDDSGPLSNGCPCTTPNECISDNCAGGLCTGCYSTGEFCETGNQCCLVGTQTTGQCIEEMCSCAPGNGCICNSNSQCATGCCGPGGLCEDKEAIGMSCYNDGQCASNICNIPSGIAEGTCACSSYPTQNTCPCQVQSDCLSGFCNAGVCEAPYSNGMSCLTPNECESGECIENTCSCAPGDGCICTSNSQCTGGACVAGLCQTCQATAMTCSNPGQCCSGICTMPDGISGQCGCSSGTVTTEKICTLPNGRTFQCGSTTTGAAQESCPCEKNTDCMSGNCVAGLCQNCFANGLACSQNYECCDQLCSDFICGGIDSWIMWIVQVVSFIVITVLVAFTMGAASELYAVMFPVDASLEAMAADAAAVAVLDEGLTDTGVLLATGSYFTAMTTALGVGFETLMTALDAGFEAFLETLPEDLQIFITSLMEGISEGITVISGVSNKMLDFGIEEFFTQAGQGFVRSITGKVVDEAEIATEETLAAAQETAITTTAGDTTTTTMTGDNGGTVTKVITTNSDGTTTTTLTITQDGTSETFTNADALAKEEELLTNSDYQEFQAGKAQWDADKAAYQPIVDADKAALKSKLQANKAADEASKSATTSGDTTTTTADTQSGATISKAVTNDGTDSSTTVQVKAFDGQTDTITETDNAGDESVDVTTSLDDTVNVSNNNGSEEFTVTGSGGNSVSVESNGTDKTATVTEVNGTSKTISNEQLLADQATAQTEKAAAQAQEAADKAAAQNEVETAEKTAQTQKADAKNEAETQKAADKAAAQNAEKTAKADAQADKAAEQAATKTQTVPTKDGGTLTTTEQTVDGVKTTTKTWKNSTGNITRTETTIEDSATGTTTKTTTEYLKNGSSVTKSVITDRYDETISRTKTTIDKNGTTVEKTDSDGTQTKTITNKDGLVYTTAKVKNSDGSFTTTRTITKDGKTTTLETTTTKTVYNGDGSTTITTTKTSADGNISLTTENTISEDGTVIDTKTTSVTTKDGVRTTTKTYTKGDIQKEVTVDYQKGDIDKTTTYSNGTKTTIHTRATDDGGTYTRTTTYDKDNKELSVQHSATDANGQPIDLSSILEDERIAQAKIVDQKDLDEASKIKNQFDALLDDAKKSINDAKEELKQAKSALDDKDIAQFKLLQDQAAKNIEQSKEILEKLNKEYQNAAELLTNKAMEASEKYEKLGGVIDENLSKIVLEVPQSFPYNLTELEKDLQTLEKEIQTEEQAFKNNTEYSDIQDQKDTDKTDAQINAQNAINTDVENAQTAETNAQIEADDKFVSSLDAYKTTEKANLEAQKAADKTDAQIKAETAEQAQKDADQEKIATDQASVAAKVETKKAADKAAAQNEAETQKAADKIAVKTAQTDAQAQEAADQAAVETAQTDAQAQKTADQADAQTAQTNAQTAQTNAQTDEENAQAATQTDITTAQDAEQTAETDIQADQVEKDADQEKIATDQASVAAKVETKEAAAQTDKIAIDTKISDENFGVSPEDVKKYEEDERIAQAKIVDQKDMENYKADEKNFYTKLEEIQTSIKKVTEFGKDSKTAFEEGRFEDAVKLEKQAEQEFKNINQLKKKLTDAYDKLDQSQIPTKALDKYDALGGQDESKLIQEIYRVLPSKPADLMKSISEVEAQLDIPAMQIIENNERLAARYAEIAEQDGTDLTAIQDATKAAQDAEKEAQAAEKEFENALKFKENIFKEHKAPVKDAQEKLEYSQQELRKAIENKEDRTRLEGDFKKAKDDFDLKEKEFNELSQTDAYKSMKEDIEKSKEDLAKVRSSVKSAHDSVKKAQDRYKAQVQKEYNQAEKELNDAQTELQKSIDALKTSDDKAAAQAKIKDAQDTLKAKETAYKKALQNKYDQVEKEFKEAQQALKKAESDYDMRNGKNKDELKVKLDTAQDAFKESLEEFIDIQNKLNETDKDFKTFKAELNNDSQLGIDKAQEEVEGIFNSIKDDLLEFKKARNRSNVHETSRIKKSIEEKLKSINDYIDRLPSQDQVMLKDFVKQEKSKIAQDLKAEIKASPRQDLSIIKTDANQVHQDIQADQAEKDIANGKYNHGDLELNPEHTTLTSPQDLKTTVTNLADDLGLSSQKEIDDYVKLLQDTRSSEKGDTSSSDNIEKFDSELFYQNGLLKGQPKLTGGGGDNPYTDFKPEEFIHVGGDSSKSWFEYFSPPKRWYDRFLSKFNDDFDEINTLGSNPDDDFDFGFRDTLGSNPKSPRDSFGSIDESEINSQRLSDESSIRSSFDSDRSSFYDHDVYIDRNERFQEDPDIIKMNKMNEANESNPRFHKFKDESFSDEEQAYRDKILDMRSGKSTKTLPIKSKKDIENWKAAKENAGKNAVADEKRKLEKSNSFFTKKLEDELKTPKADKSHQTDSWYQSTMKAPRRIYNRAFKDPQTLSNEWDVLDLEPRDSVDTAYSDRSDSIVDDIDGRPLANDQFETDSERYSNEVSIRDSLEPETLFDMNIDNDLQDIYDRKSGDLDFNNPHSVKKLKKDPKTLIKKPQTIDSNKEHFEFKDIYDSKSNFEGKNSHSVQPSDSGRLSDMLSESGYDHQPLFTDDFKPKKLSEGYLNRINSTTDIFVKPQNPAVTTFTTDGTNVVEVSGGADRSVALEQSSTGTDVIVTGKDGNSVVVTSNTNPAGETKTS